MTVKQQQISLSQCALGQNLSAPVALYQGRRIDSQEFSRQVAKKVAFLVGQPELNYALFYDEAYPFAVMLFALWHAKKVVWVAANNRPATTKKLLDAGCRLLGDWPSLEDRPLTGNLNLVTLAELDLHQTQLILYTSGSTGQPQAINKALWQLQAEVEVLEQLWGSILGSADVLATVSHQHIYGLLFRILWPLASGRCFHSHVFFTPESMLKAASGQPSCWVASPAQLKRLDALTAWSQISQLSAIFSSGGHLDVGVATLIRQHSQPTMIDIYGSSETGGIAWRKPLEETSWQPLTGISILPTEGGGNLLNSPFLPKNQPFYLNDRLELLNDGRFNLLGRSDRIVKIEEKRLSLEEMERALQQSDWVEKAHCRLWQHKRVRIACVIVLTTEGKAFLSLNGRQLLIKQLRDQLNTIFEAVVLPKKWLFMDQLLVSTLSKIDHEKLDGLLALDGGKYPHCHYISQQDDQIELSLNVPADLAYFNGHFPDFPILPGVTQLAWVEQYGKLFFPIAQPFSSMEAIKFKKIIQPDNKLTLQLRWNGDNGKLYFDFSSASESHSSGRLIYGIQP